MSRRDSVDAERCFLHYVVPELDVLKRVAPRIAGNPTDADDLLQETLLRAFRGIDEFDGRYPRAWLLTIMRNAQRNRVRRKRPELVRDPDAISRRTGVDVNRVTPESTFIDRQFEAPIERSFAATPSQFCAVIRLVDIQGLSYREAASTLNVPVGTVMSRVHRGRNSIRNYLVNDPDFVDGLSASTVPP